jgi:hypothetical protein
MGITDTSRRPSIAASYRQFLIAAKTHERAGRVDAAWACLEAAHIVGQRSTRLHVGSHIAMLGLAWRTRSARELIGQTARIVAAALATWIWVPTGNTGRAHLSATARSPLPRDLQWLNDEP